MRLHFKAGGRVDHDDGEPAGAVYRLENGWCWLTYCWLGGWSGERGPCATAAEARGALIAKWASVQAKAKAAEDKRPAWVRWWRG